MNLCSSHSHSQRRVPFALFSSPPSRPRCPDDASQKRFSWFSDWIQKVQKCGNLVDLVKSFHVPFSQSSFRTRKLFKRVLVFICKIRCRCSRERASQSLPTYTSLPLFERRRPVNGVLVRYFRFSHCAAFIISSTHFLFAFFCFSPFPDTTFLEKKGEKEGKKKRKRKKKLLIFQTDFLRKF